MRILKTVVPLMLLVLFGVVAEANAAGPCGCKDLAKLRSRADQAGKAMDAWKEIFAWARGLRSTPPLPESPEALDTKFVQLFNASKSRWDDIMNAPVGPSDVPKKIGGLSDKGEPMVDKDFEDQNCDGIVQGVKLHEREHKRFYYSHPLDVLQSSTHLRLRAESEVESYRAEQKLLKQQVSNLETGCDVWSGTITYLKTTNDNSERYTQVPKKTANKSDSNTSYKIDITITEGKPITKNNALLQSTAIITTTWHDYIYEYESTPDVCRSKPILFEKTNTITRDHSGTAKQELQGSFRVNDDGSYEIGIHDPGDIIAHGTTTYTRISGVWCSEEIHNRPQNMDYNNPSPSTDRHTFSSRMGGWLPIKGQLDPKDPNTLSGRLTRKKPPRGNYTEETVIIWKIHRVRQP